MGLETKIFPAYPAWTGWLWIGIGLFCLAGLTVAALVWTARRKTVSTPSLKPRYLERIDRLVEQHQQGTVTDEELISRVGLVARQFIGVMTGLNPETSTLSQNDLAVLTHPEIAKMVELHRLSYTRFGSTPVDPMQFTKQAKELIQCW
ncbi:hypothetical protein O6R08_10365 [Cutibacterium equinum]|uniref:DUF4381 domain-containing protein n=1 Tax=Cutibacterium equinum TaxID=3016342 RepID=A0ABY7QZP0_9ACTN|nr:hypothetical protein [Cutibacterium equinum]WCC79848.1 hypothetical protein O6R08_10365 [Cutibacterium equinum]